MRDLTVLEKVWGMSLSKSKDTEKEKPTGKENKKVKSGGLERRETGNK